MRAIGIGAALALGLFAALESAVLPAVAQDIAAPLEGPLVVELNKLEEGEGACRAFFLFRNETGRSFEGFEMSLALLDTGGVIDQLLTVDAAPLPVARTTLKLFEFPGVTCSSIAELLLHEVGACRPQNGEEMDCFGFMELDSKTDAALVK
ncbi:MAG: hypothetical protein AAGJ91_14755 [Pseudomonadota bacterium]